MKKYVYGVILVAAVTACVIFFLKPPKVSDHPAPAVLSITLRLPEGYEFTEGAPFALTWRAESPSGAPTVLVADRNFDPFVSPYNLVLTPAPAAPAVILDAKLYYCHKKSRMCFQDDFQTRVPLDPAALSAISWVWEITPKTGKG